jgi:hypothetical protein
MPHHVGDGGLAVAALTDRLRHALKQPLAELDGFFLGLQGHGTSAYRGTHAYRSRA